MTSRFRPPTWKHRITAGELPFEVGLSIFAVVSGVAAIWPEYFAGLTKLGRFLCLAVPGSALLIWRAFLRNARELQRSDPSPLDGMLHTLHAILTAGNQGDSDFLRICVFVPLPQPDTVHQLTNYVGVEPRYGSGRNLPSRCGVVGQAFRTGNAVYAKLPGREALIDYLVMTWGFTREEAAHMRQDRRSWAAIPIGPEGQVVAVIYMDSNDADFFGAKNSVQRKITQAAIPGVARFLHGV